MRPKIVEVRDLSSRSIRLSISPASRKTRSSTPVTTQTFAPGARVAIRGEEWVVRGARLSNTGDVELRVGGLSELVQGKEAAFLTGLDEVTELRPEETALVADPSPGYARAKLYLESLLRQTPPTEPVVYLGHRAAMNAQKYQLVPAIKALAQPRPRLLIADGVGLGKTLEAGILLTELIRRGRGRRILVVALKSILAQFQQELWARFTVPLVRLDSEGLARVQRKIPTNCNPFNTFNRVIISIDTLKDARYQRWLEQSHWDVTVIDECQHVAQRARAGSVQKSQRARLAELLANTCDALIMTSATPHDGKPASFASLLNLLEPTAVADEDNFRAEDVKGLYVRRFKKDIAREAADAFCERDPRRHQVAASSAEDALFERLAEAEFQTVDHKRESRGILFRTLLLKSLLSSPEALLQTLDERLKKLERADPSAEVETDVKLLCELRELTEVVVARGTTKLDQLITVLRKMGIGPKSEERVVIFCERLRTLDMLEEKIGASLKLPAGAIEKFHGSIGDIAQQGLVQAFGTKDSPVRVLLASDAASEGVNLHFFCHRLVHYDIPWSLITLEQRNGRIDRYGQKHRPELHYLLTVPASEEVKGDLRILEVLIQKEEQAHKNLGDVRWLLKLGDPEEEEDRIVQAVSQGENPDDVLPSLDDLDLGELLAPTVGIEGTAAQDVTVQTAEAPSLYKDDLAYLKEALSTLQREKVLEEKPRWLDDVRGVELKVPPDLQRRFAYLPTELRQDPHWHLKLSADRDVVQRGYYEARQAKDRWPEWQLLWPLHPVLEWVNDRVLSSFLRHEAPVVSVHEGLVRGERAFVMQGVLSNKESQPLVVSWFVVRLGRGAEPVVEDFARFAEQTGLHGRLTNAGGEVDVKPLEKLRAQVVEVAVAHMRALREERRKRHRPELKESKRKLDVWRTQRLAQIAAKERSLTQEGRKLRADQEQRLRRERERVEQTVQKRGEWLERRMTTSDMPYVRLCAVVLPKGGA